MVESQLSNMYCWLEAQLLPMCYCSGTGMTVLQRKGRWLRSRYSLWIYLKINAFTYKFTLCYNSVFVCEILHLMPFFFVCNLILSWLFIYPHPFSLLYYPTVLWSHLGLIINRDFIELKLYTWNLFLHCSNHISSWVRKGIVTPSVMNITSFWKSFCISIIHKNSLPIGPKSQIFNSSQSHKIKFIDFTGQLYGNRNIREHIQ